MLSLQEELNKVHAEDTKLQAEELALMERTFRLHEKRRALLSCKLCLHKPLGVLSKKEKKMFAKELVSIEDPERSKQGVSEGVRLLNAIEMFESMANLFDDLFDLFSLSVLAFFVNIPQFSGPSLG